MKVHNNKTRNGGEAAGLFTIGLPLVAAIVIMMSGCGTLASLFQPSFQSIAVTPPAKTVFGQGENFTYEGLQVAGVTKKGETRDISDDSNLRISGYNPDLTGEQAITVDYRGITAVYTVTVIGVESLAIDLPSITARQGLDIDRSDLNVTASYGDKITPRDVREEVTISGYNKDTPGAQTVTAEYYGKTATFDVTVAALTGIRITKPPAKVSYFSGEPLDLEGMEATGTWQGAGDAPVTPEYVSGFDSGAQGNQTVIVDALGKQASFTITVKEPSDPAAWTPAQGVFAQNIAGVVYGNGKFVAVGHNNDKPEEKIVAYSTDGITWTKAPVQAGMFAKNIIGIVYGNGKFVVAGYNDDKNEGYVSDKLNESIIVYSTDGITWTRAATPELFKNRRIFFGNGKFITIGSFEYQQTGTQQWTIDYYQVESPDGVNWSDRDPIFSEDPRNSQYIFFDGSKFVALGGGGQYLSSANNGKSWERGETIGRSITDVASGNGKMIGIGPSGLGWSTDGIVWTNADEKPDGALNAVAYGFGMFVAVGSRGGIIYSRDGYAWTKVASSTFGSTDIYHVAYGGGKFVAIGDNGRIACSNKID
jgi:hypothetical protein